MAHDFGAVSHDYNIGTRSYVNQHDGMIFELSTKGQPSFWQYAYAFHTQEELDMFLILFGGERIETQQGETK